MKNKNYYHLLPLVILSIVLFKIVDNASHVFSVTFQIISPFIWALAIAYLLNPIISYLENNLNFTRFWSIVTVYVFFLGLLALILIIITPRIIVSTGNIIGDVPDYIRTTQKWIVFQQDRLEYLGQYKLLGYIEETLTNVLDQLSESINPILDATVTQAINITSGIFNLLIGILISLYIMKDKEKLLLLTKRLMYAILETEKANKVIRYTKEFNLLFSKYFVGKILDSLIIGIICFIGLLILDVPYSLVISTIVGITNMIPYFGPFFGMIPAVIITLFHNPIQALWVFLFILALQQFDGLYLGPKILGTQVGLRPIWIIAAIIVGGGLFGVLGMVLAVPISAIIKLMLGRFVAGRLKDKNINIQ